MKIAFVDEGKSDKRGRKVVRCMHFVCINLIVKISQSQISHPVAKLLDKSFLNFALSYIQNRSYYDAVEDKD